MPTEEEKKDGQPELYEEEKMIHRLQLQKKEFLAHGLTQGGLPGDALRHFASGPC